MKPNYQQQFFDEAHRIDVWQPLVSNKHMSAMSINQDAVLSRTNLSKGKSLPYTMNYEGNGVYLFLISGNIVIGDKELQARDAITIEDTNEVVLTAKTDSQILAIEVPMN